MLLPFDTRSRPECLPQRLRRTQQKVNQIPPDFIGFPPLRKQQLEIVDRHVFKHTALTVAFQNGISQCALLRLQFDYLFFYCVSANHSVRENRLRLADSVSSVDGLCFHSGIPPRIQQKDVFGRCQVEPQTSGLQADEENTARIVRLKPLDTFLAVTRLSVEIFVVDPFPVQMFTDNGKHAGEL